MPLKKQLQLSRNARQVSLNSAQSLPLRRTAQIGPLVGKEQDHFVDVDRTCQADNPSPGPSPRTSYFDRSLLRALRHFAHRLLLNVLDIQSTSGPASWAVHSRPSRHLGKARLPPRQTANTGVADPQLSLKRIHDHSATRATTVYRPPGELMASWFGIANDAVQRS